MRRQEGCYKGRRLGLLKLRICPPLPLPFLSSVVPFLMRGMGTIELQPLESCFSNFHHPTQGDLESDKLIMESDSLLTQ